MVKHLHVQSFSCLCQVLQCGGQGPRVWLWFPLISQCNPACGFWRWICSLWQSPENGHWAAWGRIDVFHVKQLLMRLFSGRRPALHLYPCFQENGSEPPHPSVWWNKAALLWKPENSSWQRLDFYFLCFTVWGHNQGRLRPCFFKKSNEAKAEFGPRRYADRRPIRTLSSELAWTSGQVEI